MRSLFLLLPLSLTLACENEATVKLEDDTGAINFDDTGADTSGETGDTAVVVGDLEVAPPFIELPVLFVGQSAVASITVKNVGDGPVAVTVTVLGGHAADWTLDAYTSAPAPGETANHSASLTPTAWGDFSVSLLVADTLAGVEVEVPVTAHVQLDEDGDGYGSVLSGGEDCDDTVATTNPGSTEVWYDGIDADCDGANDYDQDGDGVLLGVDCDDTVATTYPGADDAWYDGADSDCAGNDDYDQDGDGSQSADYGGDDCNDTDAAILPGASDAWYDGIDSNCDGANDYDQDGDGVQVDLDCDDTDATTYPGAADTWYDGVDSDCAGDNDYDQDLDGVDVGADCDDTDASVLPGVADAWYDGVDSDCAGNDDYDQDNDGSQSDAYGGDDCDDLDAAFGPGAVDAWYDGIDSNCDGADDYDQDGDGVQVDLDCDDTDATVYPGATETWYDGVDSDCAGDNDYDRDLDGVDYPTDCDDNDASETGAGVETWNGLDDDCDGVIDDLSVTDVTTGILYGYSSSMGAGNRGQLAMDSDVTGDGLADLVATASGSGYGYGWVVSGATAAVSTGDLDDYDTALISGEQYYNLTYVNGPFADVDDDGDHDVLLGGYGSTYTSGRVYQFDGGTSLSGAIAVSSYNSRFSGESYSDSASQGAGGDFDGDGVADVVVGARYDNYDSGWWSGDTDCGSISVFAGAVSGAMDLGDADERIYGETDYDYLGVSLTVADLDGDGYDDVIAGSSGFDGASSGGGGIFVFAGNSSLSWDTRMEDAASVQIEGDSSSLQLGEDPLAHPGDIDGDGELDLGLSNEDDGSVWLFLDGSGLSGTMDVSDADHIVTGTAGDIGSALALDSDLDGDGDDDMVVGSDGDDVGASNAGAAFMFSYSTSWASALTSADASASIYGATANEYFGSGAAGGADLDGDGTEDLAIGATGNDTRATDGGAIYIIPGR